MSDLRIVPTIESNEGPVETAIPVNYTAVVTLPDGRQVSAVVSSRISHLTAPDALLDRLMDSLERQRARAEIKEFDAKIAEHEEAIARANSDIEALHNKTAIDIAALEEQLLQNDQSYNGKYDELKKTHEAKERGDFNPELPGNKTKLEVFARTKGGLKDQIAKLIAEKEAGTKNFEATMAMFRHHIAKAQKQREARVKIVG